MKYITVPILIFCVLSAVVSSRADVVEDAKAAIEKGDYSSALSLLRSSLETAPGGKDAPQRQYLAGLSAKKQNLKGEALTFWENAATKGVPEAYLGLAEIAFEDYDADKAESFLDRYAAQIKRSKGKVSAEAEVLRSRLERMKNYMERVEKVAVIDRLTATRDDFLPLYNMALSAGHFTDTSDLSDIPEILKPYDPVYVSESGDRVLFAARCDTDETGLSRIYERTALSDGRFSDPVALDIEIDGNAVCPFLMPDGTTLYFASDGAESLGGYDIFISTRDSQTGEFMQPSNLGLPYNSPADDFLIAFDEENSAGRWASTRFSTGNDVDVFVFIPSELRSNYDGTEENIVEMARLDNIRDTWGDVDYTALATQLREADYTPGDIVPDFIFPVDSSTVYTSLKDFKNEDARQAMEEYLEASAAYDKASEALKALRRQYAGARSRAQRDELTDRILRDEKELEEKRSDLNLLRNNIYELEISR